MHTSLRTAFLLLALAAASLGIAAEKSKSADPAGDNYPLKTCLVSDEPLGGDVVTYTHKQPGQPDRVVRLCCEGCIEDFRANPGKFLKKLDAAAAAAVKKPAGAPAPKS
jgi:hypothetical protein